MVNLSPADFQSYIESFRGPYAIENSIALWALMTRRIWHSFTTIPSPTTPLYDRNSLLRLSLTEGPSPLSYIRFGYTGKSKKCNNVLIN